MNPHECSQTWQVVRSEFDQMLLENAGEHGAEVWQNANVTDILLEPSPTDSLPRATGIMVKRAGETEALSDGLVLADRMLGELTKCLKDS